MELSRGQRMCFGTYTDDPCRHNPDRDEVCRLCMISVQKGAAAIYEELPLDDILGLWGK